MITSTNLQGSALRADFNDLMKNLSIPDRSFYAGIKEENTPQLFEKVVESFWDAKYKLPIADPIPSTWQLTTSHPTGCFSIGKLGYLH